MSFLRERLGHAHESLDPITKEHSAQLTAGAQHACARLNQKQSSKVLCTEPALFLPSLMLDVLREGPVEIKRPVEMSLAAFGAMVISSVQPCEAGTLSTFVCGWRASELRGP